MSECVCVSLLACLGFHNVRVQAVPTNYVYTVQTVIWHVLDGDPIETKQPLYHYQEVITNALNEWFDALVAD